MYGEDNRWGYDLVSIFVRAGVIDHGMIMKETLQELGRSRIGSCYQEKKVKYTAKKKGAR
jgi:hypothetical protein